MAHKFCFFFFFKKIALVSYKSHAVQFTHSMVFSMFTKLCTHHHNQFWNIFITHRRNSMLISSHYSFFLKAPGPWQALTYTLSLQMYLLLNISYKRKIQYVVFVTSFFNLACFQGSSILQPPSVLPFFLFMGQTILTVWIYLILHLSTR